MKSHKMLSALFAFTVLLLLVSLGFNAYQYKQIKGISEKITSEKVIETNSSGNSGLTSAKTSDQNKQEDIAIAAKQEKTGVNKVKELEYHLNAAEEEVDMANEKLSEELTKKEGYRKARDQLSRSMLSDAAMKRARESSAVRMSDEYDPLFKKLDISEEKFEKFKDIVIERSMKQYNFPAYTTAASDEEKKEVLQNINEVYTSYNNKIRELLGDENYQTYQFYTNRMMERRNFSEFIETLPPDTAITDDQADLIIDKMYDARIAVYTENPIKTTEMSDDPMELRNMMLEKQKLTNEKYLEASREILTPDQAEQYKAYLQKKTEMEESMMKISNYLNDNN